MKAPVRRTSFNRQRWAARLILPALLTVLGPLAAHESHDSIAEASYNRDSSRLEVTLSVHAADLENALSRIAGTAMPLEDLPAETILAYLTRAFIVQDDQGAALPLAWVGKEPANDNDPSHQLIHLHFEVLIPAAATALRLHQTTFCELHDDQINLVEFRDSGNRQTLGFSPQHPARMIPLQPN